LQGVAAHAAQGENGITAASGSQMDYVSRTRADALLERGVKDATYSWQIRSDTSLKFWMRAGLC
jgi:hypothetical protein